MNDIEIGSAIILASEIDIMKFIKSFKNEVHIFKIKNT